MICGGYWTAPDQKINGKIVRGKKLRKATEEERDFYHSDKWDDYEKESYPEDIAEYYRAWWE